MDDKTLPQKIYVFILNNNILISLTNKKKNVLKKLSLAMIQGNQIYP